MDELAKVLLHRQVVAPALLTGTKRSRVARHLLRLSVDVHTGVHALEGEALQRGFVFSAALQAALRALPADELLSLGHFLLNTLDEQIGSHVKHVPLFRRFPHSVPADTDEFYVRRVFTYLAQEPDQPCVLCGTIGSVRPVAPCAHLICRHCWDGTDLSACPICHRRIALDDPFLQPADPPAEEPVPAPMRRRLVLLGHAPDAVEAAREIALQLVARETPLSPQDQAHLSTAVAALPGTDWIPSRVPVRETRAVVLAGVLPALAADRPAAAGLIEAQVDTATDVLRVLSVMMGGDPGLRTPPPRRTSINRALRRALLARMDRMRLAACAEDLLRHAEAWKHLAEVLHPFEFYRRFPNVALAFVVLRGTRLDPSTAFGRAMFEQAAHHTEHLMPADGRLRLVTFGTLVETALRDAEGEAVVALLRRRPGELVRRLCHLARVAPLPALLPAVRDAVRSVAPGVLVAALGQMRTPPGTARLFLPAGPTAKAWIQPESQPELPANAVRELSGIVVGELLQRAESLPPLGSVLVDDGLADLAAPTAERSATAAQVRMPRGSTQPLPDGERIRFFLHWAEPEGERVDLDLSMGVYDEVWDNIGICSYSNLRLGGSAAVHSGDLTSAPEPLGASEFVDLDIAALRGLGGRYVTAVVFSYNDVPFEKLVRGFGGFMSDPAGLFDPLAVEQRFDLAGPSKILLLLVIDLWTRTFRWIDLNLQAASSAHFIDDHEGELARIGSAFEEVFGLGDRVTLWEISCWNAAARSREVVVRRRDGAYGTYLRRADEDVAGFANRLIALTPPDRELGTTADLTRVEQAALVRSGVELPAGISAYALYPWSLDGSQVRVLDAADLVAEFAPERTSVRVRPVQIDLGVEPDTEPRRLG